MGVELQTTGSWSGSELVSIFKMRIKEALFDLFGGIYSQTLRQSITPASVLETKFLPATKAQSK